MDRRVRFPLNRAISILIDFEEYDNQQKGLRAFVLERKVIDKTGYKELRVRIPKSFVERVKNREKRKEIFQWIEQKSYKVFYHVGKTRVVVMDNGVIKFKGPSKSHTNELHLKKTTFSTMLSFIDTNFNRDDETVDENASVTVDEGTDDDQDDIESDGEEGGDVEMDNSGIDSSLFFNKSIEYIRSFLNFLLRILSQIVPIQLRLRIA